MDKPTGGGQRVYCGTAPQHTEALRVALNNEATMRNTLTRAQERCTQLTEELRELKRTQALALFPMLPSPTPEQLTVMVSAIARWGNQGQLLQLDEECTELALAVKHYLRKKLSADRLAEETADVLVMISQLVLIMGGSFDQKVQLWCGSKLARLAERLGVAKP